MPEIKLAGLPLPLTLRPAVAITDDELIALSRNNRSYRIERNARGELEIMSPSGGDGSRWESRVIGELDLWAKEHFYKGPTGIFDSTVSGFILAAAYLVGRRNLWAPILAHGISDTIAVLWTFLGW